MTYPPEPWHLRGQLHASVFLVPLADLTTQLPPGCRPVRLGRRGVVGAAWVSYEPGGVLSYRELMATVLVRRGWRVLPTIVAIWVDSEASRDGGRALWGIPKELAQFEFHREELSAQDEQGMIATATVRVRRTLPRRWPSRFSVVQRRNGVAKISPVRARSRIALSSATFDAAPDGSLGFLAGRRPLMTFSLRDFEMSFGAARGGRGHE